MLTALRKFLGVIVYKNEMLCCTSFSASTTYFPPYYTEERPYYTVERKYVQNPCYRFCTE